MSKLSNVLNVLNGSTIPKETGNIPAYGGNGIIKYVNKSNYKKDTIIVGRVGAKCGSVNISKNDCWITDNSLAIIVKEGNDPYYFYYLLKLLNLNKYHIGSSQPLITQSIINDIDIDYCNDLDEQVRISKLLKTIDDKINNNLNIMNLLENKFMTTFDYWFTQYNYSNKNVEKVYNNKLNKEIPKNWSVDKLSKIITSINTGLNPRNNFKLGNGEIKYITVKNININGTINFENCDLIDENALDIIHKRSDISKNDILYASISPLGRAYLIQDETKNWDINESVYSIRPNTDLVSPFYLYMFLRSKYFIKTAEHSSTGSIFKGIRIDTILNMDVLIPDKETAYNFEKLFKNDIKIYNEKDRENNLLKEYRNFLLPLLMNGQVTING